MVNLSTMPDVNVTSTFWRNYRNLIVDKVLPYQWAVMADEQEASLPDDPSSGNSFEGSEGHTLRNIEIAAGLAEGHHTGYQFQDSDLYKWLEAAAYALKYRHDETLKATADRLVELLAKAQAPDGYLVTMFQIDWPQERFKRLRQSHELYTMGHYIEAAVAYYEVTGSRVALDVACRMADCIDANFGSEPGKIHGVDGHPEIEIALPRLYEVTGEHRYLDLATFFLHERGTNPAFFDEQFADGGSGNEMLDADVFPRKYYQIDKPFTEQTTAEGHAVRVVYLCEGAAHVARLTGDAELREAAERLWSNIVRKRMYITGQVGSTHEGEAFTCDYDLPNDTMYGESCASVGMAMLARRLLEIEQRSEYADVLEKQLFNGAISGMSLDGSHFYYVNPLEADPVLSALNPDKKHVLTHRAEWFGCSCCPANIARLVASVDRYIYTVHDGVIYSHQFIANQADFGGGVTVEQRNNFPWDGHIEYTVCNRSGQDFRFAVRIPEWSRGRYALLADSKPVGAEAVEGFVAIPVKAGCAEVRLSLDLDMSVKAMEASPEVRVDAGKIAFMRGPVVFCAEAADNPDNLWQYRVPATAVLDSAEQVDARFEQNLLGGVETLTVPAHVIQAAGSDDADDVLYRPAGQQVCRDASLTLVPYYAWANRQDGQMAVWLNRENA